MRIIIVVLIACSAIAVAQDFPDWKEWDNLLFAGSGGGDRRGDIPAEQNKEDPLELATGTESCLDEVSTSENQTDETSPSEEGNNVDQNVVGRNPALPMENDANTEEPSLPGDEVVEENNEVVAVNVEEIEGTVQLAGDVETQDEENNEAIQSDDAEEVNDTAVDANEEDDTSEEEDTSNSEDSEENQSVSEENEKEKHKRDKLKEKLEKEREKQQKKREKEEEKMEKKREQEREKEEKERHHMESLQKEIERRQRRLDELERRFGIPVDRMCDPLICKIECMKSGNHAGYCFPRTTCNCV